MQHTNGRSDRLLHARAPGACLNVGIDISKRTFREFACHQLIAAVRRFPRVRIGTEVSEVLVQQATKGRSRYPAVCSNACVNQLMGSAHGTISVVTPHLGQLIRRAA